VSDRSVPKSALAIALALAGLLGVGFFGYSLGTEAGARDVDAAVSAAREEIRKQYEGEEYRQEVIAQLLAIVRSPTVDGQLTEEARQVVRDASEEIGQGDLQAAAELLPGVLAAISRDCVPEDQSVAVLPGTPVQTCHVYGTKALIGPVLNADLEVRVTIDGDAKNIMFGTAYRADAAACDLLVERRERIEDQDAIWVSFAC
jgi:hypothetical protein